MWKTRNNLRDFVVVALNKASKISSNNHLLWLVLIKEGLFCLREKRVLNAIAFMESFHGLANCI